MPASTLIPKVLATIGVALAVALGFTTYTAPNHAGAAYSDIHDLIALALGDARQPPLPGPPSTLPIGPLDTFPAGLAPSPSRPAAGPTEPRDWIARAVTRDSAALRGWLGGAVVVTAAVQGDTARTTLWRVTLHPGCPLVSRMQAISVGHAQGSPQLAFLTADCPRLTPTAPTPVQHN
jgi:hypothetical protein